MRLMTEKCQTVLWSSDKPLLVEYLNRPHTRTCVYSTEMPKRARRPSLPSETTQVWRRFITVSEPVSVADDGSGSDPSPSGARIPRASAGPGPQGRQVTQRILSLATVQGADTRHFCSRSAVGLAEWAALTQGVQDRAG